MGSTPCRRQRDRDDEYREREEPRLQPARSRLARPRAEEPGAVPLSDEGARSGSGARARRVRREGHQAGDLRRGHRDGAPLADPQMGERRPDQPGHAPRGRPPPSRPLGRRAREPPLRGRRRGARLPRRVRVARGERAPAASPARPRVRLGAAVHPGLGDDRERTPAGRIAARRAGDGDRQRRGPADRADDRALEPGADRRGARHPRELARRRLALAGELRRARPAHDLLRQEPEGRRADPPLRIRSRRRRRPLPGSPRTAPATRRRSGARSSSA